MIKMVMGLSLMESSTYLFMVSLAYRAKSTAPVLYGPPPGASAKSLAHGNVADPVLQNFCLTAIIIGVAITAVFLTIVVHYMGLWTPARGHALGIVFVAEPFGIIYAFTCAVVGALLLVYTLSEQGGLGARELGGYACLCQLLLAALIGAALTGDLFNLFVWFQLAALASYGLTGFYLERPIALEAAFKIVVLTTIASFIVFTGIGLLYARHGALNFGQLHGALAVSVHTADLVALGLLVAGFATKAGLIPFHGWLADAHEAAPGPVSALFSGLMVAMGILAIVRLAFQVYPTSR